MTELLATLDPATTIVHVHCWTKALSSSVVAAVARAKFPMVMTLHEYFTACPTGCLYLHRDRKVCTLTPMSVACIVKNCDSRSYLYKAYRVVRQLVQRTFGRIPSGIGEFITVSEFSRSVIERYLRAAGACIPSPIPCRPNVRRACLRKRAIRSCSLGACRPKRAACCSPKRRAVPVSR